MQIGSDIHRHSAPSIHQTAGLSGKYEVREEAAQHTEVA